MPIFRHQIMEIKEEEIQIIIDTEDKKEASDRELEKGESEQRRKLEISNIFLANQHPQPIEFPEDSLNSQIAKQMDSLLLSHRVQSPKKTCSCEAQILIVDDNIFNLIPLELILKEMFKLKVDKAMNGQEAVNAFSKNIVKKCCQTYYKLILMDLNMPVMDGYEATVEICESFHKVYPDGQYHNGD